MKKVEELRKKRYTLLPEEVEMCRQFAKKVSPTNKDEYARRNQNDMGKIEFDNFIGKMAEIAVWRLSGEQTTEPDFAIYTKKTRKKKSFEADLFWNNQEIHVKSQELTQAKRFDTSWLFQKKDKLNAGGEVVFTVVGEKDGNWTVVVFSVVPTDMIPAFISKPKKQCLQESKWAIYYKDIKFLYEGSHEDLINE